MTSLILRWMQKNPLLNRRRLIFLVLEFILNFKDMFQDIKLFPPEVFPEHPNRVFIYMRDGSSFTGIYIAAINLWHASYETKDGRYVIRDLRPSEILAWRELK